MSPCEEKLVDSGVYRVSCFSQDELKYDLMERLVGPSG